MGGMLYSTTSVAISIASIIGYKGVFGPNFVGDKLSVEELTFLSSETFILSFLVYMSVSILNFI